MRRSVIGKLRSKGRSLFNADPTINKGQLSVCRRPNAKYARTAKEYLECDSCGEYLRSTGLRRHWNVCTGNPLPGVRVVKKFSRIAEGRVHVDASKDLQTVFSKMGENEEVLLIRFDWIVVTFGNDLCINLWRDYQMRIIRSKLRSAGTLLSVAKSLAPEVTDFASLCDVTKCNTIIAAIRRIAGFDPESKEFRSPTTATTIVTLTKQIGALLKLEYMKRADNCKAKAVKKFLEVFEQEAKIKINKQAYVTRINNQYN